MQPPANRQLPQDVEAERMLLGALFTHQQYDQLQWDVDDIRAILAPKASCLGDHQKIFTAITDAHDAGEPMDLLAIVPRLQAMAQLDRDAWQDYTIELAEHWAEPANALFYARLIRTAWQKRELISALLRAHADVYDPQSDLSDIITSLTNRIDSIEQASTGDQEAQREAQILRLLENPRNSRGDRVPVGIGRLGHVLDGGLERGTMTVVGARPSCGKTSLGLTLCVQASKATEGCACLFASCEMTAKQIGFRLLSMRSGLAVTHVRAGGVDDEQFVPARNRAVLDADRGRTIFILDGTTNARVIAAHARRYARRQEVGLIVIDYLGLCDIAGRYDRHDLKIGAMSALFKNLARETNAAVVVLKQLNRASENEKRRPRMADLRDSGRIEADADNIILIHKGEQQTGPVCDTTLILAKQRQGEIGDAEVLYRKATMSYEGRFLGPEPASTSCNVNGVARAATTGDSE